LPVACRNDQPFCDNAVVEEFVIARNPDGDSSLPYLIRLPLGREGVVLKVREMWPRTAKVYCHRAPDWPADPDIVERVDVRSCVRRGAAIDLILDRGRENRSQFVFTIARGREMIFWQSARTAKQARPNVTLPTARASGHRLEILVDVHERYPWTFAQQQATTVRRPLPAGDYAVDLGGQIIAAVERKSLADLSATMTGGRLRYLLAALAAVPRAVLVVEDRYSQVFKLDRVRPLVIADGLAEAQVRFPTVPIVFCETRPLAQEWAYRFLGAAVTHALDEFPAQLIEQSLPSAGPVAQRQPTVREVRAWANLSGITVTARGRLPAEVWQRYRDDRTAEAARDGTTA
jgi:ERCC4 domain